VQSTGIQIPANRKHQQPRLSESTRNYADANPTAIGWRFIPVNS